jgi:nucleotide-binding universal stress UspA family protein
MNTLARVLAAVDFSRPSRNAFDFALALARSHRAELVAVHAVPLDETFDRHGKERLALKADLRRLADAAQVPFAYRVQQGDPAEIVLLHALSIDPDVIVVGSHQRSGLARLRVGSVSERIVTRTRMPVLVVPAGARPNPAGAFRHVAVAVGDPSGAAVERGLQVASEATERVTLLHAVPGYSSGVPPHLYRYGLVEYEGRQLLDARRALKRAVPAERRSRATIHTRILRGDTTTQLDRAVETIGADVLVVGVPRRGIVANALFGSTAARLLKMIDIPLLAVPVAGPRPRTVPAIERQTAAVRHAVLSRAM